MELDVDVVETIFRATFLFKNTFFKEQGVSRGIKDTRQATVIGGNLNSTSSGLDDPLPAISENLDADPKTSNCQVNEKSDRNPRIFKWRIDGALRTTLGLHFFILPTFFRASSCVDVVTPKPSTISASIRRELEYEEAFQFTNLKVINSRIAKHILQALEHWTDKLCRELGDEASFEKWYSNLPWRSSLYFHGISADPRDMEPMVAENHNLESKFVSVRYLKSSWAAEQIKSDWPRALNISQIELDKQLYSTVSLIKLKTRQEGEIQTLCLKSCTSEPHFLYHELKGYLTLPPHPNIMPAPSHVVTKACEFGVSDAVIGFTTPFYTGGTLRSMLPTGKYDLQHQITWSTQVLDALIHVHQNGGFYSDLKPENIVLTGTAQVKLIDFEQRGLPPPYAGYSAPEVDLLNAVNTIATANPRSLCVVTDEEEKLLIKIKEMHKSQIGPFMAPSSRIYANYGCYSPPWQCLTAEERESCQVYLFAKLLWCIFEGQGIADADILRSESASENEGGDTDLVFLEYRNTPKEVRYIIDKCTESGVSLVSPIIRKGDRMVVKGKRDCTPADVIQAQKGYWQTVLHKALEFMEWRRGNNLQEPGIAVDQDWFRRPTFNDVKAMLDEFSAQIMRGKK